ncbi:MAG: FAD binding domain-containing protein [Pseudomonadota bacterium]
MTAYAPRTLEEALAVRLAHPEATPVAGGTDLMVAVNAGAANPHALLDLSHVSELAELRRENGDLTVGSGVTFAQLAREASGPLAEAAAAVASPQVRNRATLGGNVCTASPAGDGIAVLAALDAEVVAASAAGARHVPWDAFLTGPKKTALREDELVTAVTWRVPAGSGAFVKVGLRGAMVIAVASACVQLDEEARHVRLALGSVAPSVVRARRAEAFAAAELDWDDPWGPALHEFARLAASETTPIDDGRATAAYRRHAVEVIARRALERALGARRRSC